MQQFFRPGSRVPVWRIVNAEITDLDVEGCASSRHLILNKSHQISPHFKLSSLALTCDTYPQHSPLFCSCEGKNIRREWRIETLAERVIFLTRKYSVLQKLLILLQLFSHFASSPTSYFKVFYVVDHLKASHDCEMEGKWW